MNIISNKKLTIKVNPLGAELASITNNKTKEEYLWQADPTFWKRHSPILFPIVGGLWNSIYTHKSKTYELSQHGFARDNKFELIKEENDELRYLLKDNEKTLQVYPFHFNLEIRYQLIENKVKITWLVRNTGSETMYFQIGAHPAFNYPQFDKDDEEHGYFAFDLQKDLTHILIKEKGCADPDKQYSTPLNTEGLLPINRHLFDKDALIFENSQTKKIVLLDKSKQPYITLYFDAPVVGLWSPPTKYDCPFVCIEPWYGRCDRVNYSGEFKNRDWMNSLKAGGIFEASYIVEVNR